jgi:hypothetical protein
MLVTFGRGQGVTTRKPVITASEVDTVGVLAFMRLYSRLNLFENVLHYLPF